MSQNERYRRWMTKKPCPICGSPKDPNANLCRNCFLSSQGPDGSPENELRRFWAKVDKNGPTIVPRLGPCWIWRGSKTDLGYGRFNIKRKNIWIKVLASRYCYELSVGPIPEDKELDHLCRNTSCCNPSHSEPITHQENVIRGMAGIVNANRQKSKMLCVHGHKYNKQNTYLDKRGHRHCRICMRNSCREAFRNRRIKIKEELYVKNFLI